MNILIVGCGKVGSGLANSLSRLGHDLSVVDGTTANFDRLDEGFTGYTIQGVPIDLEVLRQAGIEACDCLLAVYDDDNVNIMVSQVAREIFQVPKVLTRIYDPQRGGVFAQFGLQTICPTSLTVDVIEKMVEGESQSVSFGTGTARVSLGQVDLPQNCRGYTVEKLAHDLDEMAVGVVHPDGSILLRDAQPDYRLQEGDSLLVVRVI